MQEQAEGYKAKVIGDAQGNTARFTSILGEYEKAPAVMRQRMYLESMEIFTRASKVMVDTKSNNNMLYRPWTRSCTWPPRTPPSPPLPPARLRPRWSIRRPSRRCGAVPAAPSSGSSIATRCLATVRRVNPEDH